MKTWKLILRPIILAFFILTPILSFGQILAWQYGNPASNGNEVEYKATTNNSLLNTTFLSRGSGVTAVNVVQTFSGAGWNYSTKDLAVAANAYYQFTIMPISGCRVSLSSLDAVLYSRVFSGFSGPTKYIWKYSIDGGNTFIELDTDKSLTPSMFTTGTTQPTFNLSVLTNLQKVISPKSIVFRLYAWGANSTLVWAGFGFGATSTVGANSLAIGGSVEALTLSTLATSYSCVNTAKSTPVLVFSNTTWTATSNSDWLTVSSGKTGNGTLTCNATANPTINNRIAIVTLKAEGLTDRSFNIIQSAGAATLSVSATSANLAKTANSSATIDVISNTTWTATSDQSWLTANSCPDGDCFLVVKATTFNPTAYTRSATVTLKATGASDKTITVTQEASDPILSLSSGTVNLVKIADTNTSIQITSNSIWTATSNQSWLTVNSGATGNGTLTCTAPANPTIYDRIATVNIKATNLSDRTVVVTQAAGDPVSSLSSATATVAKTANSTTTVNVACNTFWTVFSDQSWLTVNSGETNGDGVLTCTATSTNMNVTTRIATVTLKAEGATDKTLTVTQAAGDPTLSLSAITATVDKTLNSKASITVTSNTTWTATSNQGWLSVTSGASGNATLTFTASEINPTIGTRKATVTIKATGIPDEIVTVTQKEGDATLTVSAYSADVAKTANIISNFNVTSNTAWTAASDQDWLTVNLGASGSGTLTCTTILANPSTSTRTANVTLLAGSGTNTTNKTVSITQAAGDPVMSVSTGSVSVGKNVNSTGSVGLTTNVSWTATADQSWLAFKTFGFGNETFNVKANSNNPGTTPRQAIITIKATGVADKTITVTQAGSDPIVEVAAITASVAKTLNATATVNVSSNTLWTISSNQTWLSVTPGTTGNATVTFSTTSANPTIATRTAIVTIKATGVTDKTITITQAAGDASLSVSENSANVLKVANSSASINVESNSAWTATSDQTWLTVTSGASGTATLTLTANTTNPTISTRLANVKLKATGIADKIVTITQAAGDATLSVSATTASISEGAYSTAWVNVTSNSTWTTTSNQSWLTVTTGATGNGSLTFTADKNLLITTRSATVTVKATGAANKVITVTQQASAPYVTVSNSAVVLDPNANNTTSVNISSNTTWNAASDQSWLNVSSDANGVLTFSAANSTVTRQAIVTVSASGVSDNKITVIQSATTSNNKYQLSMTVTSILTIDDTEIATNDIQLSAFIETEKRGTAILKYVESYKRYMAFIMVWGNADDVNKTITFKSYDPISSKELLATHSTLKFLPENITGSTATPYSIDFYDKIPNTANKQLTLKVYLEGLWNGTNMNKCKEYDAVLGDVVDKFDGSVVDTLSVELHNATYSNIAYRITGLQLNQDGTVHSAGKPYIKVPDVASGNYHITIRTRNHLETTTRALVPFSGSTVNYDFTDAVTKAFESDASFTPMKQIDGKWMLYSGNPLPMDPPQVNSDAIDFIDLYNIMNNSSDFTSEYGYLVSDLNGDGSVDFLDIYDFVLPNYDSGVYFYFPE